MKGALEKSLFVVGYFVFSSLSRFQVTVYLGRKKLINPTVLHKYSNKKKNLVVFQLSEGQGRFRWSLMFSTSPDECQCWEVNLMKTSAPVDLNTDL